MGILGRSMQLPGGSPGANRSCRWSRKHPYTLVKMASRPEFSKYQFTIWIQLKKVAEDDTRIKITIEPHVNKMLLPMIKGPLKKFVNGLIDKMESFRF